MGASTDAPGICVIGVGNLLARDDGFGPVVVQWLEEHARFPGDVELVDVGTAGLHLLGWIVGRRTVILVDAIAAGGEPGRLRVLERSELVQGRAAGPRISQHQPELREILRLAELSGDAPRDVLLIGVEPADLEDGIGLSPAVEAAVEPAARRVIAEIERRGAIRATILHHVDRARRPGERPEVSTCCKRPFSSSSSCSRPPSPSAASRASG